MLDKEGPAYQQNGALKQAKGEIKRLTEELRQSEERFRAIFEASQDSIYLKDRNLCFTAVNPAFVKQVGIPAKKLIGTTGRAFINKKALVYLQEEESRVLKGEIIQRENACDITGASAINRLITVPMRDDTGEIVGLCCISRDITERTRTEELLRQERESLYAILHRAPYGVMVQDQDGKTLYVNSEFTTITGYTLADIPTIRDWGKLAYPRKKHKNASRAAWEKDIAQRATDGVFHRKLGRLFTRTYSIVTKGGAIKDIEFRPTLLADGRILLMLSDITERKRAEEALRQNEEQLRMLIETTKVGVSAIDGKGVTAYANEQLCTMLGRSSDEIVGHSVFDFLDARNRKILKTFLS